MKIFIYILITLATALLVYNVTKVDFSAPFQGESIVAVIGVVACLCAIVLMTILLLSRKIATKVK